MTFLEKLIDLFFEDEPLEIDENRTWENYLALAMVVIGDKNMGEWGGRVSSENIKGYLFWCWIENIDYYSAVKQLEQKLHI